MISGAWPLESLPSTLLLFTAASAATAATGTSQLVLEVVQALLAATLMLVVPLALRDGLTEIPPPAEPGPPLRQHAERIGDTP